MATPTIVFPWSSAMATPSARITKVDDDSVTQVSTSCVERTNAPGIYDAAFSNPVAGDYYIIPRSAGVNQEGIGIVFNVTNTASIFYESELSELTLSDEIVEDISTKVIAGLQAIPGLTVEVTSPTDENGAIEVRQGDAYLVANNRNASIGLTGSLPLLETACSLHVFFGGNKVTYSGTITVNSSTSYTLKFPFTGTETAAMPVGTFMYEAETTYQGTTNKWTPSSGTFTVLPQIG